MKFRLTVKSVSFLKNWVASNVNNFEIVVIETVKIVKEIDFEISREYTEGVFESCRRVILPASSGFAMNMACGFFDSKTCTAERWVRLKQQQFSYKTKS